MISSLVLSGVCIIFDLHTITGLNFKIWILIWMFVNFIFFRIKFGNTQRFKYFLLRKYVLLNSTFQKLDVKVMNLSDENAVTPMQEKAVKLWKLCLRDRATNITCSISNRTRQIEKDNMLIILSPLNQMDYLMTILDTDNTKSCTYEIRINSKLSESVISSFDIENERRMREGEDERRNSIYNDLDKLLLQEEKALKNPQLI